MSASVSMDKVGEVLGRVLASSGRTLLIKDQASGEVQPISTDVATAPDGLLPVFLAAGEAVWRDSTKAGFNLRLEQDPSALLGYRAAQVSSVPFAVVLLSTMEAIEQAATPGVDGKPGHLLVNDLNSVWRAAAPTPSLALGLAAAPTP